jgi:hypothetical protein
MLQPASKLTHRCGTHLDLAYRFFPLFWIMIFFSSKQQCIGTEYYQVVNRIIPIYCNNGHSRWKVFKAGLLANLSAPIHDASRNSVTGVLIIITTLQSHRMAPLLQQWLSITSILRGCLLTVFHHFFISLLQKRETGSIVSWISQLLTFMAIGFWISRKLIHKSDKKLKQTPPKSARKSTV